MSDDVRTEAARRRPHAPPMTSAFSNSTSRRRSIGFTVSPRGPEAGTPGRW